jgi:hypothetical protein
MQSVGNEVDPKPGPLETSRADQQVFESDVDSTSCLLAFNPPSKLCDFHRDWMYNHVVAEFFSKGSPSLAVHVAFGPVDPVSRLDDGYQLQLPSAHVSQERRDVGRGGFFLRDVDDVFSHRLLFRYNPAGVL